MKHISLIFTTAIFFSFLSSSCTQEIPALTIPSAPVNFKIDLMTDKIDYFDYAVFESPRRAGEYVGYAGLLIFRNQEGQIFAYDLCCPKERSKTVKVIPNSRGELFVLFVAVFITFGQDLGMSFRGHQRCCCKNIKFQSIQILHTQFAIRNRNYYPFSLKNR